MREERECGPILVLNDMEDLQHSILLLTLSFTSTYSMYDWELISWIGPVYVIKPTRRLSTNFD